VIATPTLSADITPATLTLTGITANDRVYDTTRSATLSGSAGVAPLGSDDVVVVGSGTGFFNNKNVGTNKTVKVSGLSLGGADAGNYVLVSTLNADITPATLTVSGLSASDKVYDTTTAASLSGSAAVTPLGTDSVTLSGSAAGVFDSKNVGTNKQVSVSGLTLSGADAGNYVLAAPPTLTADITPATLTVSGLSANNKVYDTTVLASLSGTAGVTPLGSDTVTVGGSASGAFDTKNVGNNKPVTVSGLTLGGADAGNYVIVTPALNADITPATLTLTGLTANNKVYDATTNATLSGSAGVVPLGTDAVTVSGSATGTFDTKNVGTAKPVTVSGLGLSGADAGNYVLVSGLSADITPATLTVTGLNANNKVYDGTTAATFSGSAGVTPLGGDAVSVGGSLTGTFSDKNAGTGKAVAVGGLTLSGADAGNYVIAQPALSADITPASLTINAQSQNKAFGTLLTFAGTEFFATGLVAGEQVASVTLTSAGAPATAGLGVYPIVASQAVGGTGFLASNYNVTYLNGALSVVPSLSGLNGLQDELSIFTELFRRQVRGGQGRDDVVNESQCRP
jgi:trimeric autotransporter adhesin